MNMRKRPRNGIKTVMFTVRLDEDIHKWLKESRTNASELINERLRWHMNRWYGHQQTMQFENIPPFTQK